MLKRIFFLITFLLLSQMSHAFEVLLSPAENGTINIIAKNISPVYGGEVLIGYDNQFFDVVDQDEKKKGTQIEGGSFFSEGAYLLDNSINLRKGEIHFATAHVRPMDDASGNGVIASFRLKAKKSGDTIVEIKKAEFGTQEGELLKAPLMQLNIVADASGQFTATSIGASEDDSQGLAISMEALLMLVIAVLLILVIILLLRKK